MVGALDVLFNRFDADPAGMEEAMENSSEFGDLMRELGRVAGAECGLTESGAAISEILVYLADEAATRPSQTTEAVLGVMMGICRSLSSLPVELTYEGQAACAGTG
jgi:hypothetical protein